MIAVNPIRETQRCADNMTDEKSGFGDFFLPSESLTIERNNFLHPPEQCNSSNPTNNYSSEILDDNGQYATTMIPSSCRSGISILMELPLKIISGVSDFFNPCPQSPDSEIPAKRPYSPKLHHSKQMPTDVARGRGRGRGRSQLRRSGVSQARHRHERNRQQLTAEIRDDVKGLREYEEHQDDEELPSSPCINENGYRILYGADGAQAENSETSKFPLMFGTCEVKRSKQRHQNRLRHNGRQFLADNCKVRYVRECPMEDNVCEQGCKDQDEEDEENEGSMPRRRMQSYGSVDSEDSCWILFEPGSESEQEIGSKVRFAPHPTIHTMVTWDYAYRAARKGPWQEMARDRERFKIRINWTSQILDPILVPKHRSEIWQQRFTVTV